MGTLKTAYSQGGQAALDQYGVDDDAPSPATAAAASPSLLRRVAPWLAAGGAAGLGYKYLRTPSFSKIPGLRKLQEEASQKGFHRIVDLSPVTKPGKESPFKKKLEYLLKPKVDPKSGKMDLLNRLKFRALEGGEAIPVASTKERDTFLPMHKGNKLKVEGVTAGRNVIPSYSDTSPAKLVRGGSEIEGSLATQKALTEMGEQGKDFEAKFLSQHSPESIAKTMDDISPLLKGLDTKTPQGRAAAAKALHDRLQGTLSDKFLLKPTQGLQSSGQFPWSGEDWGKHVERFDAHMADPLRAKALADATEEGAGPLADYLARHKLLEGKTLSDALHDPRSAIAQSEIENPLGEWRVHTLGGAAPRGMMAPRFSGAGAFLKGQAGIGDVSTKKMQEFAEAALAKMPPKYREGNYGMDIMPHRKPDGSIGYKIVELNPSERAHGDSGGGGSGFLDTSVIPYMGHAHYRAATGRHTGLVSALGGLGAAGAAGGLTRALLPSQPRTDDEDLATAARRAPTAPIGV